MCLHVTVDLFCYAEGVAAAWFDCQPIHFPGNCVNMFKIMVFGYTSGAI